MTTALARLLGATRAHLRDVADQLAAPDLPTGVSPFEVPPEVASSPLGRLFERFGLGAEERHVLAVLIAHQRCVVSRQLIRDVSGDKVPDPTFDALCRIVYPVDADRGCTELGPHGALRTNGFVESAEGNRDVPEYRQMLRASQRVLAFARGDDGLDPEVGRWGARFDAPPLEQLLTDRTLIARIEVGVDGAGLVVVKGRTGSGRRSILAAIAHARGHAVLAIDAHELARDRDELRRQLRVIARECRLLELVPLFQHLEGLGDQLDVFEQEISGRVLATSTNQLARRWTRTPTVVELPPIDSASRMTLWGRALPAAGSGDLDVLSTLYPLAPALIAAVGRAAMHSAGATAMSPAHVEAGLRSVLDDRLGGLATRVKVTQRWSDLVLPDDQATAVTELLARIRKRRQVYETWGFADKVGKGLGVSALFSGPPGTGKTMCAGLIARELGTELYQVDVSKMSSKWIGETEKNLAALFDAAEAGHAILLFDEADSLFGKRTEVRSSNDRHANQETGYLLQRLESFAGICILTTNHESAIDEAFRRRLSIHVRLPVPDLDERRRLWKVMIPRSAPIDPKLDVSKLADKYVMTGGYIRNAVLRAAFLAADEEVAIGTSHLTRAAQLEYEAMGKVVTSN